MAVKMGYSMVAWMVVMKVVQMAWRKAAAKESRSVGSWAVEWDSLWVAQRVDQKDGYLVGKMDLQLVVLKDM